MDSNPTDKDESSAPGNPPAGSAGASGDTSPLSEATKKVADAAAKFRGKAEEKFSEFSARAKNSYEDAAHRMHDFQDEALEYVRQNPFTSIALAFVAGAAVGYSLGR